MTSPIAGLLALENGRTFHGVLFGARPTADRPAGGEVCFNTSMTGYQEVLTDPSYAGQIVTMTTAHVGNYGVCPDDVQSDRVQVAGFVVRDLARRHSSWRATQDLDAYLADAGVGGIAEVDTRALTRLLRDEGAMRGAIGPADAADALVAHALALPQMTGQNLASRVTTAEPRRLEAIGAARHDVAVYDFGVKNGILDHLRQRGCALTLYPASTPADQVLAAGHDGVLLSNGPGDPDAVTTGIDAARGLLGKLPVFGICLGHQILALACGAKTFKLKFGHRGSNHPVRDQKTGEIAITAQNHGFAVDPDSVPDALEVTHVSLNDGTVEGLAHRELPAWSVQHHPEASPGPHDACPLFDRFVAAMAKEQPGA